MPPGFRLDPAYADAVAQLPMLPAEPGEILTVEALVDQQDQSWASCAPIPPEPTVVRTHHVITRADGSQLHLRWYSPPGEPGGAAMVFVHGGGMIAGDVESYDPIVAQYVARSGTPFLAVEYRLAPQHPYPSGLQDVVTAIEWLIREGPELGVDPARVGVMGDSGGGGIAAGAALYCRDHGIDLALQLLLYPMLDDRTRSATPGLLPFLEWTPEHNALAWDAVLREVSGDAPAYAAPARADDLSGLPPTYLETGELDLFRGEILLYATRLTQAGVSTELHLRPGLPHAFEFSAPHIPVTVRAFADRYRVLADL